MSQQGGKKRAGHNKTAVRVSKGAFGAKQLRFMLTYNIVGLTVHVIVLIMKSNVKISILYENMLPKKYFAGTHTSFTPFVVRRYPRKNPYF